MRATVINGRVWLVEFTNTDLDGDKLGLMTYGSVDGDDSNRPIEGMMQIDGSLVGKDLMVKIFHEWLHGLLPMAKEEWVDTESQNLGHLICDKVTLTKIGLFNNIIIPQETSNEASPVE